MESRSEGPIGPPISNSAHDYDAEQEPVVEIEQSVDGHGIEQDIS